MRTLSVLLLLTGCLRGTAGRFTTQNVVPTAARVADVDRVCQTGGALGHALAAVGKRPPDDAMIIAHATAALCDEAEANELALQAVAAPRLAADPVAAVKDLKERERRVRARAAGRFNAAWAATERRFGTLGETCPTVPAKEELTFLVGLMSGTLAMLHDKASGSTHDVPLDTLNRVGRAAPCVEGWWNAPDAFQAAAWATVPGSGPADVDPWAKLVEAAEAGDGSGVRLGWALAAVVADNAGREDVVETAVLGAAASRSTTAVAADYALFDQYAFDLLQYQADRRWIAARGHRVAELSLPTPEAPPPAPPAVDPFAEDPFAEDTPPEDAP